MNIQIGVQVMNALENENYDDFFVQPKQNADIAFVAQSHSAKNVSLIDITSV
jgi:hypothetical protein